MVRPTSLNHDTALLYIGGGGAPASVDFLLASIGVMTNSVTAELRMIPNQPLHFTDEQDPEYLASGRTEDEMIAYAWDKFYRTGDPEWLPRLPMTKAVLRAMDP